MDDLGKEVVGSSPQKGERAGSKGRGAMPAANVGVLGTNVLPRICSQGPALSARGCCVWKVKQNSDLILANILLFFLLLRLLF